VQVVQQQQLSRIRELEQELMSLRARHTDTIHQLKKAFLDEKHECQANADKKIAEMSKQANQVINVRQHSSLWFMKPSMPTVVFFGNCCDTYTRWCKRCPTSN